MNDTEWMDDANCAEIGMDFFFPEKGGDVTIAKGICAGCDVANQCLEYAITNGIDHGIWGGLAPAHRRQIRVTAA